MNKQVVWNKIKERKYSSSMIEDIIKVIEQNFERIEFVKDHVGVRDFLFIAEEGTKYAADFFTSINVECEKDYSYLTNLRLWFKNNNANTDSAYKELVNFFDCTDRTLYIGIGFKESEVYLKEELAEEILSQKYEVEEEILKKLRKFPKWFEEFAKWPEDINFITVKAERYIKKVLRPMEKEALKGKIDEILSKEKLSKTDKVLLKSIVTHLAS
ncbi:hypothetical protein [Bacillus toyonensis]|uniref:hypothetical protein n=1 Tax=Bacillus toyonensis TaxID=155322 RepID=UPI002E1C583F|nr:hypothetical protein [Bacillus toyonensis]